MNPSLPTQDVSIASNGGLVLTGGRHRVRELFAGESPPPKASVKTFWENHLARTTWCNDRSIKYLFTIFPDKIVPYSSLLLDDAIASIYLRYYRSTASTYPLPLYLDVSADDYMKTDTHLSTAGVISSIEQIVLRLGGQLRDFREDVLSRSVVRSNFAGDLGLKFSPQIDEEAIIIRPSAGLRYETNGMTSGNDGTIDIVYNENAKSVKTVLMFGDSFFRQLMKELSYFYSRVICIRSRYFHYESVEAFMPDIILAGCAERYFSRVPSDDERPHFLSYPLELGRAISPSEGFAELWKESLNRKHLSIATSS
ncbi:MAG: hypothetical protein DI616_00010 [Paracoccus denitrificans]|uniref:AlgX/AlgJ SGNH hydrolase-like domain-containing protein n=1 Tax=Paracoccus denitrificans TaxID=266 RepID=A0A533IE77_PARDE|nr:MAG: hypothetical protein DI616_00010 [Paracoccus denitrificans]